MSSKFFQFTDPILAEGIQRRCNQILEETYYADSTANLEEYKNLTQEYNELSHKLEGLHVRLDPLISLPSEVWILIIREATYQDISDWDRQQDTRVPNYRASRIPSTDAVLVLTMVCKHWSHSLLNTPSLWTTINIGYGGGDAQAKLQTALFLSRDVSIDLILYVPHYQLDADLPILRCQAHRIKSISITYPRRPFECTQEDQIRSIDRFFLEMDIFPKLRSIGAEFEDGRWDFCVNLDVIFEKCRALCRLKGLGVTLDQVGNRSGTPFRDCTIHAPVGDIMRRIEELKYIEDLILIGLYTSEEDMPNPSNSSLLSLPTLRSIDERILMDYNSVSLWKLCPNLTDLSLTIKHWQNLYDLLNQIGQLPYLSALTISIAADGKFEPPNISSIRTQVRYLHVRGIYRGDYRGSYTTDFETHETLFSVFSTLFPNVVSLELHNVILGPHTAHYIGSTPQLRSLLLRDSQVGPRIILISSHGLETMEVIAEDEGGLQALRSIIKCPLLSLTIIHPGYISGSEGALIEQTEGNQAVYVTVETLNIDSFLRIEWQSQRFTALRKLRLWTNHYYTNNVSEFLLSLIINPLNCPALEEIQLLFVPEWDLLFIMLERRNYLPLTHGIVRINTIVFESPISSVLLVPLANILGGRFTKRPSNFELSFSSLVDSYFDPSIPGCDTCLRSMTPCSGQPVSQLDFFRAYATHRRARRGDYPGCPLFSALELPSEPLEIPTELWKWLNTRKDRL